MGKHAANGWRCSWCGKKGARKPIGPGRYVHEECEEAVSENAAKLDKLIAKANGTRG